MTLGGIDPGGCWGGERGRRLLDGTLRDQVSPAWGGCSAAPTLRPPPPPPNACPPSPPSSPHPHPLAGEDQRLMAGRCLGELVRKMGDRILAQIIPILRVSCESIEIESNRRELM